MKLRDKRAALALGLTLLALALPCIAWYLVGTREVRHQAAELTDNAQQAARARPSRKCCKPRSGCR